MSSAHPGPYEVEPRPRRPATPTLPAIALLVGSGLGAYGFGTSAYSSAPSVATIVGFLLAIIGLISWLIAMAPWPIDLNGHQGLALFGIPAGLGLAAAVERDDLNDDFRIAAAVLAGSGAVCLLIGVLLPLRRRKRYLRDLQLMADGDPRPATAIETGLGPWDWEEASNVITWVTFQFTGADGTAYRLNRIVSIPGRAPLADGHETVVWHDPAHPADPKRMVIAMHHALRWNVPLPTAQIPESQPPAISS
ncbi:hypothetical protein [Jongsikchunia kroppenstedtii]|uniref:hypothetical protein n=1 Tax=Jongsikchunia kroppenstedtii TaxID=1121721 RepID=UPI00036D0FAB|nr:hypothetical protein [Jongsikchunia kroppenstedtii]